MCTRIYRWHYHSLLNAIGTLQGRGSDGPDFLETAKMCGLSSDTSLPAARCAGGSVFILRAKRRSGGKMENGGLCGQKRRYSTALSATLGVPARHDRERRCHATAAHSRLPIAGCSQQAIEVRRAGEVRLELTLLPSFVRKITGLLGLARSRGLTLFLHLGPRVHCSIIYRMQNTHRRRSAVYVYIPRIMKPVTRHLQKAAGSVKHTSLRGSEMIQRSRFYV